MSRQLILAAHDFSAASDAALAMALGLAAKARADLLVVHVCEPATPHAESERLRERLGQISTAARGGRASPRVSLRILEGAPAPTLARAARVEDADMIVVGTHARRGIARLMLGSVAEELMRDADRPVLIAREGDAEKVEAAHLPLVLAAVDLEPESDRVAEEAAELAQLVGGRLRLFHADPPRTPPADPEWRESPDKALARIARRLSGRRLPTEIRVREGEAADTILAEAHGRGASFIVMGTHGRRGARRLLFGSVATAVLRRARVPVLVVRSQTPDAIGEGAAIRSALFRAGLEPT